MSKVYKIDVEIAATLYIKAESVAAALIKAKSVRGAWLELPDDIPGDLPISGAKYSAPDLPEISLSPAMTVQGIYGEQLEVAFDPDE